MNNRALAMLVLVSFVATSAPTAVVAKDKSKGVGLAILGAAIGAAAVSAGNERRAAKQAHNQHQRGDVCQGCGFGLQQVAPAGFQPGMQPVQMQMVPVQGPNGQIVYQQQPIYQQVQQAPVYPQQVAPVYPQPVQQAPVYPQPVQQAPVYPQQVQQVPSYPQPVYQQAQPGFVPAAGVKPTAELAPVPVSSDTQFRYIHKVEESAPQVTEERIVKPDGSVVIRTKSRTVRTITGR